ncbi:RluA family pseudouridine synthase [Aliiglaciecola litoralis]
MANTIIDNFVAPECLQQIDILLVDEHFLLINKPSGLLSLSGKNPLNKDSVHFRLTQQYPSARMVHRLDLGTSGIMLIALNKLANTQLAKQFEMGTVQKTYISVLDGHVKEDFGQIDIPIAKDPLLFPRLKTCVEHGKPALTEYQVLDRQINPDLTRIQYYPKTGRTHQLRIHSQYMGHPILGCDLYGNDDSFQAANRLMLHAEKLQFDHPFSGERILGECPSPF